MGKAVEYRGLATSLLLSAIFTYAFLYVTQAVPSVLDLLLRGIFPEVPLDLWREVTESALPYGYVALAVVALLIAVGLVSKWVWLSKLGALGLYLPTFGYFALAMFLLAGIGALRTLWLPILYHQIKLWRLGDAVLLPVHLLTYLTDALGLGRPYTSGIIASLTLRVLGAFIFFVGVTSWLYGRYRGLKIVDLWIYRYSRHPQYLGFLLWSYGLLTQVAYKIYIRGAFTAPPTLIWLATAAILTLVALKEEESMVKKYGEAYLSYAAKTPFYLPLPKPLMKLLTIPHRLVKYEVGSWRRGGLVILIYVAAVMLVSYMVYY